MAGRRGTLLNGLIVGPRWLAAELVIAALRFTRWIHGDQVVAMVVLGCSPVDFFSLAPFLVPSALCIPTPNTLSLSSTTTVQ